MPELNIVEKVIALEAVELLKNLTPEQLSRIATIAREVKYPPGKMILDPKQPAGRALRHRGRGGGARAATARCCTPPARTKCSAPGRCSTSDPMPVTAKTVEDTRLLRIGRDDFYDLLSDNVEITAAIFSTLVKRFRKLVEQ